MEPLEEVSSEEDWSEEAWAWSSGDLKDWVEPSRFTRVLGCAGSTCMRGSLHQIHPLLGPYLAIYASRSTDASDTYHREGMIDP